MELGEIMMRNVEVIGADKSLKEAAIKMEQLDVGLIPICDGDQLKGVLSDRDIVVRATAEGLDPTNTKVADVMSVDVAYCFEDQDVAQAANLMRACQVRRLPILNQDKRLVGIVSLGDVAVYVGDLQLSGETLKKISNPTLPRNQNSR